MGREEPAGTTVPSAAAVLRMVRKCRITHIVGLPDNCSARLFSRLDRRLRATLAGGCRAAMPGGYCFLSGLSASSTSSESSRLPR